MGKGIDPVRSDSVSFQGEQSATHTASTASVTEVPIEAPGLGAPTVKGNNKAGNVVNKASSKSVLASISHAFRWEGLGYRALGSFLVGLGFLVSLPTKLLNQLPTKGIIAIAAKVAEKEIANPQKFNAQKTAIEEEGQKSAGDSIGEEGVAAKSGLAQQANDKPVEIQKVDHAAQEKDAAIDEAAKGAIQLKHKKRAIKVGMWGTGIGGILPLVDHILSYIGKAGVCLLTKGMQTDVSTLEGPDEINKELKGVVSHFNTVIDAIQVINNPTK
jgi:hypothetical protein